MSVSPSTTSVGFIGLGIMGGYMAGHIRAAGYALHVYNRTKAKAQTLLDAGATWHDTPGEVAAAADITFTIVGYPKDVEDIYLRPGGLVDRARPRSVLVDMTTSSPSLAQKIARQAASRDVFVLDAPVSGGDVGARNAKLSIMVGGDAAAFARITPLLALMGTNVVRQGDAGAGQHTKMANQIVVASNMLAVAEGLAYAKAVGLDPAAVLGSIGSGAAQSFLLNGLGPKMLAADWAPGFYVHHFLKDLGIALDEAEAHGLPLPGTTQARTLYRRLADDLGGAQDGTQALFKVYLDVLDKRSGGEKD